MSNVEKDKSTNYPRAFHLLTIPFRPKLTRTLARVDKFTDIEVAFLLWENIRCLIIDIDGTLIEHGRETLPPEVI